MNDQDNCSTCGYSGDAGIVKCPQCGSWMKKPKGIRTRGWVQVVMGILLVIMMSGLTAVLAPIMFLSVNPLGKASFSGSRQQVYMILGLFAIIGIFGMASIVSGVFQIITGRRNVLIMIAIVGLAFVLIAAALAVSNSLDKKDNPGMLVGISLRL